MSGVSGDGDHSGTTPPWRSTPQGAIVLWAVILVALVALVAGGVALVRSRTAHQSTAAPAASSPACRDVKAALVRVGGAETLLNSGATTGDQVLLASLHDVVAVIDSSLPHVPVPVARAMGDVKQGAVSVQATISAQYQSGTGAPTASSPSTNQSLLRFTLATSQLNAVCAR